MKHRILSLLLALVFLLSVFLFSTTAFAASNTADGLTAVLESDKDAYVAGDNVGVSLTVTNTSEDITNIRTELIVPQGLDLVEGQLISDAVNLTVGESAQYSYVLSVPVVEVPTTAVPTTQTPTTQPDTGDESPETRDITMLIYGSVAVLALVGLMVLAFGGKLMKQRWFVLLICASLLLGVLAPVAASAAVAEKSFEVTKAITIDGNAAEIKAIVTYDLDDKVLLEETEVVFSKDGTWQFSSVLEKGWYSPNGITMDGWKSTDGKRHEVTASYIDMLFGTAKKAGEFTTKIFSDTAAQQALIGRTDDIASLKALAHIEKDEWIVTMVDGKLVITGWFDNATVAAARWLYKEVTTAADPANVTLTLPMIGKLEGYTANIPDCTEGTFLNGMDGDNGIMVLRYGDVEADAFEAYCADLKAAGFQLYQENEIVNYGEEYNLFATYVKGDSAVHVAFLPNAFLEADQTGMADYEIKAIANCFRGDGNELRIITDKTENLFTNEENNKYEDLGISPKYSFVNLYNKYADGNDIGALDIFTLADGSFIVVDGGYSADADQLYNALVELNERPDGKIVVAAWFLSHDHGDHVGAINVLAGTDYAKNITIEQIIFTTDADTYMWRKDNDPYNYSGSGTGLLDWDKETGFAIAPKLANFNEGDKTQFVHPYMGQKMCIRNAEVTVYHAGVIDLFPVHVDNYNDVALVLEVELGGQEILLMTDASREAGFVTLGPLFSEAIDSDILQTSHHGLGNISSKFTPLLSAKVAVWHTTWRSALRTDLGMIFYRGHNAPMQKLQWPDGTAVLLEGEATEEQKLVPHTDNYYDPNATYDYSKLVENPNGCIELNLMCDEYMQTLELPFDHTTDRIIKTKLGTFKGKYEDAQMSIATLGVGRFGKDIAKYINATADLLLETNADVLVLNSVSYQQADGTNVVKTVVDALNYPYYYYAPAWNQDAGSDLTVSNNGTYGNLILSRFPIESYENLIYHEGTTADSSNEGRGAGHVVVRVENKNVDIYFTEVQNASSWNELAKVFKPESDVWFIVGVTKNSLSAVQTALGDDTVVRAIADHDRENIYASGKVTLTDGTKTSVNAITGCANMDALITVNAAFSCNTVPSTNDVPVKDAIINWTANGWGRSEATYNLIIKNLRQQNAAMVAMNHVCNQYVGATPAQIAEEAGYEYYNWVTAIKLSNGYEFGHLLLSHYPIEEQAAIILTDYASDAYGESRAVGHVVATIDGRKVDIYHGFGDNTTAGLTKALENVVQTTAAETGRAFIVAVGDMKGVSKATVFAGYEVENYTSASGRNTAVMVSASAISINSAESVVTEADPVFVEHMDVVGFAVTSEPIVPVEPTNPEEPEDPEDPVVEGKEYSIINWTANGWGRSVASYNAIIEILKEQNADIVTMLHVCNKFPNATPAEIAAAAGYEYYHFAPGYDYGGGTVYGHMIMSHIPFEVQEDIAALPADTNSSEGRGMGHVLINLNGVETDLYYGYGDNREAATAFFEAAIKAIAEETGRPFILSAGDLYGMSGATTAFAGKEVETYYAAGTAQFMVNPEYMSIVSGTATTTSAANAFVENMHKIVIAVADSEPEAPASKEYSIINWTANGWGRSDASYNAIVNILKEQNADIVTMIHVRYETAKLPNAVAETAAAAGYEYYHFVGAIVAGNHTYGNLILSHIPLEAKDDIIINSERAAGHVVMTLNGVETDFYYCYGDNRPAVTQALEAKVAEIAAETGRPFIVSTGDMGGISASTAEYAGADVDLYYATPGTVEVLVTKDGMTVVSGTRTTTSAANAFVEDMHKIVISVADPVPETPTSKEYSIINWTANGWGRSDASYNAVVNILKEQNADIVTMLQVRYETAKLPGAVAETAAAAGYEYYHFVGFIAAGNHTYGHLILSHIPFETEDDIIITDLIAGFSGEARAAGHVVMTLNGVETDLFYGYGSNQPAVTNALEAKIAELAEDSGRPFIVSTGDMGGLNADITEYANKDVSIYYSANGTKELLVTNDRLSIVSGTATTTAAANAFVEDLHRIVISVQK